MNVEGISIKADDFNSICRCCLCNCKNIVTYDILSSFVFENVGEIISKFALIHVSKLPYLYSIDYLSNYKA